MTKQDVLNYFDDINEAYNNCNKHDDLSRMLDELVETQPRWIPVSERLPKDEGDYLVTFKLSFMNFIEVCTFNKAGWDKGGYDEVVAWMTLPEPYRGGDTDAK